MTISITTKLPEKVTLGEIYQSMQTKQALVKPAGKDTFERITPFVLCRDFLVDVYTFSEAKKAFEVYGMYFAGDKEAPAYDGLYMLQRFPKKVNADAFQKHLKLLQTLEEQNGMSPTKLHILSELEYLLCADADWLKNCLYLSLYTLLLRGFSYDTDLDQDWWIGLSNLKSTDGAYFKSVPIKTWERVADKLSLLDSDYFCGFSTQKYDDYTIHHNSGFISVVGKHSEQNPNSVRANRHWALLRERGLETFIKVK